MRSELIIACHGRPDYLRPVLASVAQLARLPETVCIAEDGEDPALAEQVERWSGQSEVPLRHVRQPHTGRFGKNAILNRAIATSDADYLIFTDGDCILQRGFVSRHLGLARPHRFLSGTAVRLDRSTSEAILKRGHAEWAADGRLSDWSPGDVHGFLRSGGLGTTLSNLLEQITPMRRSLMGLNASCHRQSLIAVNGFDEAMAYGGEDKELGVRLTNAGVRGRHVRYSAVAYHLDHDRPYVDHHLVSRNRGRILTARRNGKVRTENGIAETSLEPQSADLHAAGA